VGMRLRVQRGTKAPAWRAQRWRWRRNSRTHPWPAAAGAWAPPRRGGRRRATAGTRERVDLVGLNCRGGGGGGTAGPTPGQRRRARGRRHGEAVDAERLRERHARPLLAQLRRCLGRRRRAGGGGVGGEGSGGGSEEAEALQVQHERARQARQRVADARLGVVAVLAAPLHALLVEPARQQLAQRRRAAQLLAAAAALGLAYVQRQVRERLLHLRCSDRNSRESFALGVSGGR
jgi:hypothetical protein